MGKLTFKGEPKKKKHKSKSSSSGSKAARATAGDDSDGPDDLSGWIAVPSPPLALGPLYLTLPPTSLTSTPVCLALQPTTGKVYPFGLPTQASLAQSAGLAATLDAEELDALVVDDSLPPHDQSPSDIHHVWVCTRIPDSENKITLRSATGKFLAADELGQVTADREARGMLEEWSIEASSSPSASKGAVVLRSSYGKLLSVDVVAGGKMELRADESDEGETERWGAWMQGEYLAKAKQQLLERTGTKSFATGPSSSRTSGNDGLTIVGDLGGAEQETIKKYQARGAGRIVGTDEAVSSLEKARKKGKLAEAMLDRRIKLKSDRYC